MWTTWSIDKYACYQCWKTKACCSVLYFYSPLSLFTSKFPRCFVFPILGKFSKINCFIVNNITTDSNWFLYGNFSVTGISSILNLSPDCLIFLAIWLNIIYILYFVLPFSGLLLKENFHFLSWPCLASLPFLPCLIWLMSKKDISAFVLLVLCSLLHI